MIQVLNIIFGWVLGIVSTIGTALIFRSLDRQRRLEDFKKGLRAELSAVLPRLVYTRYYLQKRLGQLDHESLDWYLSGYRREQGTSELIRAIERLAGLSEPELEALSKQNTLSRESLGQSLKSFHIPFIEANTDAATLLPIKLNMQIARIRTFFRFINEEKEAYDFYLRATFQPEIVQTNQEAIDYNMKQALNATARRCLKVADEINDLLTELKAAPRSQLSEKLVAVIEKLRNVRSRP